MIWQKDSLEMKRITSFLRITNSAPDDTVDLSEFISSTDSLQGSHTSSQFTGATQTRHGECC